MSETVVGTFLFTDLVGSTALSSSLRPEAADELRQTHFGLLRGAVTATGGKEIKTLGDGIMVMFRSPRRVLDSAVAMQQAVARHNRRSPHILAVRIGIAVGDATEEEGDFFGEPVIEAARLCAAAQGGQILVTDVLRMMARRSGHGFANEREMELKGLPDPVVVWDVQWTLADEDTGGIPLPPRLPHVAQAAFVGRQFPSNQLADALKAVRSEPGVRVVLITGEAGIGKTALAASFARAAHGQGVVVLYGRCDEELTVPYQPFVEAVGHYAAGAPDTALGDMEDERLGSLMRLVPELRLRRHDVVESRASDPDAERWMLYQAVAGLLQRASEQVPLVLVLDDLHWADAPTLQLLPYLASHHAGHVLVVGTYRHTELSAAHPLTEALAALSREGRLERITLDGLDYDDVVTFLQAVSGHALGEDGLELARALVQETDGNPFFVTEVLRHLVEARAIVQEDTGRWTTVTPLTEIGLPDGVRQVVSTRVARLGDAAVGALAAAAVVGQEFGLDVVARVIALDEDELLDILEAAASAALVAEVPGAPGRFRFAHALIQHTLYAELGATRRARLHRRTAEALEALIDPVPGPLVGELARHWLATTEPSHAEKAAEYARLAGERALDALAPSEALRWFATALGALPDGDDRHRATCLAGLGEAQRQVGDASYRETLLEAARIARRAGDVTSQVRAALANNRGGISSGAGLIDAERIEVLEQTLEALGPGDSRDRARLLSLLALERSFDGNYRPRRALADEAMAMARRLGDPATELEVMLRRYQPTWTSHRLWDEQEAENRRAEVLADEVGDPVGKFWAKIFGAWLAIQRAELRVARQRLEDANRIAREVGQPMLVWTATFSRCWVALVEGDLEQAETLTGEALQLGTDTSQPDTMPIYGSQLHSIRWHQGRLSELADTIAAIAADNPGIPSFRAGAAVAYAESDRLDRAQAMLDGEMARDFPPDDYLAPVYFSFWSEVAVAVGDRRAAEVLYDRMLPWAEIVVFSTSTVHVAVAHLLGSLAALLGRVYDAAGHLEHALRIHERLDGPFYLTRTQLELARVLRLRALPGDDSRAETLRVSASLLAERHGFARLAAQARTLGD